MNSITRTTPDGTHTFHGPNATLINWMETSPLAQNVLNQAGLDITAICGAFSVGNPEEQAIAAKRAIGRLWHAHPELGPYPFLDTLSDFEYNRRFYPDYREHVNHQLRVFWLGLYLFDTCDAIRERAFGEASCESAFLRRWTACAIWHDIGYLLENEGAVTPDGPAWTETCRVLNETMKTPLSRLPQFKTALTKDTEWHIRKARKIIPVPLDTPRDMEFHDRSDLLDRIAAFGAKAGLGFSEESGKSPFRLYYDYAFQYPPKVGNRSRFRDHGIAGAMLLLKIRAEFLEYVENLSEFAGDPLLADASPKLAPLRKNLASCEVDILSAAAAIALHNIAPHIWNETDTLAHGLTLSRFRIRLYEDDRLPGTGATPLAFLLGLTDTLQTWDRWKFRAVRDNDTPGIDGQKMSLCVRDGNIRVGFKEDDKYKKPENVPESLFGKIRKNLEEYLDQRAVSELLVCGEQDPACEEPPIIARTSPPSALEKPVRTNRYRLSIVARDWPSYAYLVFVSDGLGFGNPNDPDADVQVKAGGIKPDHCRIVKADGAFFLVKNKGRCDVSGKTADKIKLKPGQTIRLGATFEMTVGFADATVLVLEIPDSDPVDSSVRGILLTTGDFTVGPGANAHVSIPHMQSDIRLRFENGGFVAETGPGKIVAADGKPILAGGVRISVTN